MNAWYIKMYVPAPKNGRLTGKEISGFYETEFYQKFKVFFLISGGDSIQNI